MLNPRRANSDDTRASTPALFSTSTERMWWREAVTSVAALAHCRAEDDLVVRRPGGDHRVDLLPPVDPELDDHGPVVDGVGLLDGGDDLVRVLHPHALAAH